MVLKLFSTKILLQTQPHKMKLSVKVGANSFAHTGHLFLGPITLSSEVNRSLVPWIRKRFRVNKTKNSLWAGGMNLFV
jgi:hypothetical protein